jgi:hypothetical protein
MELSQRKPSDNRPANHCPFDQNPYSSPRAAAHHSAQRWPRKVVGAMRFAFMCWRICWLIGLSTWAIVFLIYGNFFLWNALTPLGSGPKPPPSARFASFIIAAGFLGGGIMLARLVWKSIKDIFHGETLE